jgi:hypothetical protein
VATARLWDIMRIYAPAVDVSNFAQTSPRPWSSLLTIAIILASDRGASAPQPYAAAARPWRWRSRWRPFMSQAFRSNLTFSRRTVGCQIVGLLKSTRSKRSKMRQSLVALTCMIFAGTLGLSSPALAQQKTVKACQEEWRADKAGNQSKGITEKAYVAGCRVAGPMAQPTAPPARPAASPQATPAKKTVKVCQEEWRANKAANQTNGITERAYVEQCRAGGTGAQSTPSPTPAAQTSAPSSPAQPPPVSSIPKTAPAPASTAPAGPNQFSTEAQAKGHCPSDTVVWVNLDSKIYHYAGHKVYGHTKSGAYICESDTGAQGMRASKNEKRPG